MSGGFEGLEASELAAFGRKTYALLGLSAGCGEAALRKAFKAASLKYHPDKQHGKPESEKEAAGSMFLKVKEAYELLSDEKKRSSIDNAVLAAERATRANTERLERMEAGRRRMREDLEKREAAAAAFQQKKAPVDAMRRANEQRAEDYARERSRAARAAARSAEEETRNRASGSAREKADILRRSLKIKWKASRPATDDEIVEMVTKFGRVISVSLRPPKGAVVVFENESAATDAAIDEALASRFKDVKLCTHDAFDRVRDAVNRRKSTRDDDDRDRNKATETSMEDAAKVARRRAAERASLEAEIRAAENEDGGLDPPEEDERDENRDAKRRKLAAYIDTVVFDDIKSSNEGSDPMRSLLKKEFDLFSKILARETLINS